MKPFLNEEVWELHNIPIYLNPTLDTGRIMQEYYRVIDIFDANSLTTPFRAGLFIPRSLIHITPIDEQWLKTADNQERVKSFQWPVIRRTKLEWFFDLTTLNRL